MDKAQKQLIDTYFRKREIAAGQYVYDYGFENYEKGYFIKTGRIDAAKMIEKNVLATTEAIKENPKLLPYFIPHIKLFYEEFLRNSKNTHATEILAMYFNLLLGKMRFFSVSTNGSSSWGDDTYLGKLVDRKTLIFINGKGEPDLSGLDVDKVFNGNSSTGEIKAAYFNQLKGKDVFRLVGKFFYAGFSIARAELVNGKKVFINKDGDPEIEGLDNSVKYSHEDREEIINNTKELIDNG